MSCCPVAAKSGTVSTLTNLFSSCVLTTKLPYCLDRVPTSPILCCDLVIIKYHPPAHYAFGSSFFEMVTPFYDGIVWLNTASAEEDLRLLRRCCLFSPTHQQERQTQVYKMINIAPKTTRPCAVPSCGETVFALPSF